MFPVEEIDVSPVYHLPIVKAFAERIDLVKTINLLVPSNMKVDPGTIVLAMVLDTLSGRHPLYHINHFYDGKDIELLLGQPLDCGQLNDDNCGRVLELLFGTGTMSIFSAIIMNVLRNFKVPAHHAHCDTTSLKVYGEYEPSDPDRPVNLKIVKGYSKDHRPDLNQIVLSLLCIGGNVPILAKVEDGNASDKKINNALLTDISQHLAKMGITPAATIHISDSALVSEENLRKAGNTTLFISRFPATYR
ncbi:MAG: IS1634 family transposase, partial [Deltaproteobacteria bacterium]|nr:IS1634 family transposase [Deltaproteobacteria bacterium]